MKLISFGDSWTEGVGSDLNLETKITDNVKKTKIRNSFSWPTKLAQKLNIDIENNGIGGCSNKTIFDAVCLFLDTNRIKKDDFVIIMWSSSLRDDVPFFPNDNKWHFWGERYIAKEHLYKFIFDNSLNSINKEYTQFKKKYNQYFFENLYTNAYYHIINQNYILYLQFIFKELGINYLFCDAFDFMLKDVSSTIDKTHLIDRYHYYEFSKKTLKDVLIDTNRKDVWEDNSLWEDTYGKHPSKIGYEIISDNLYNWIIDKNLLNSNHINKITII